MKAKLLIAITVVAVLIFQTSCTKVPLEQTKAARIKEIYAQLAKWVATGRPEDAEKRVALKAERALLAADLGYSTSTVDGGIAAGGRGYASSGNAQRYRRDGFNARRTKSLAVDGWQFEMDGQPPENTNLWSHL